jgi:hypothetical protein
LLRRAARCDTRLRQDLLQAFHHSLLSHDTDCTVVTKSRKHETKNFRDFVVSCPRLRRVFTC